ncbi:hypothetical protein HDU98_010563 [Podochytrium sp. JEL0797]|nr:hypothetical protein HDU98_010563 [Podochytrium sp. JEL0797]
MWSDSDSDAVEYATFPPGTLPPTDDYTRYQHQLLSQSHHGEEPVLKISDDDDQDEPVPHTNASASSSSSSDSDPETTTPSLTQHFRCPISMRTLKDPVVAADGVTYERSRITEWLGMSTKSPSTNLVLSSPAVYPNVNLRQVMLEVKKERAVRKRKREERRKVDSGPASEEGVFVYVVVKPVKVRHAPSVDFGLIVVPEVEMRVGQVVSADLRVRVGGVVFVRLEGTSWWVFEAGRGDSGIEEERVLEGARTMVRCLKTVRVRRWPDYSDALKLDWVVRKDEWLKTELLVKGENEDLFARVEGGWVFASKKGTRYLEQVTEKGPRVPAGPGRFVNVTLMAMDRGADQEPDMGYFAIMKSVDERGANRFESAVIKPRGLAKRIQKLSDKGQSLDAIVLASDGAWSLSAGNTGIPSHWSTGNLDPAVADLIRPNSMVAFSNKGKSRTRPYVVIYKDGTFVAKHVRSSLMDLLKTNAKRVESLFLAENGDYFVSLGDNWVWEFADWELCRALERGAIKGGIVSGE